VVSELKFNVWYAESSRTGFEVKVFLPDGYDEAMLRSWIRSGLMVSACRLVEPDAPSRPLEEV